MTKTEILRQSAALLNEKRLMERLESQIEALRESRHQSAEDLAATLEVLRTEVTRTLESLDEVMATQRRTLDELAQEMSRKAAEAFDRKVTSMEQTLETLEQTSREISGLPEKLTGAQQSLARAADRLIKVANKMRPRLWRQALGLILVGVVSAMLVATGQVALSRLVPPSDVQKKAEILDRIWSAATSKEKELLKQIVNRPAN